MEELDQLLQEMDVGKVGPRTSARPTGSSQAYTMQQPAQPQGLPALKPAIQSHYFRACPNCGSDDVSTNQSRGYSRCERCLYTVDPSHRPSQKQLQQQQLMTNTPYVGTNAVPLLQQTRIRDNQAILSKGSEGTNWELFHACQTNDIKKIKVILDMGVSVNCRDTDTGSTPLHWACSKSQQHAIRYLVERGADINAQNKRGLTPLHSLIINRIEPLAFWLIKKGADVTITDNEGNTAVDLALPWTQREMEDLFAKVRAGALEEEPAPAPVPRPQQGGQYQQQPAQAPAEEPLQKEVMKIFLKSDAYKSMIITNQTSAKDVCELMAEKLNIGLEISKFFEVTERVKKGDQYLERKLDPTANLFALKAKWPLIFGESGNETQLHCRFIVNVKAGTPANLQSKFREAVYGGK